VVVFFGLMGTGKTVHAKALSAALNLPVIHSDAVRKGLAGLAPTTPRPEAFGKGIYDEDFSRRTYAEMRRQAQEHLAAGRSVILDGSYKRAPERDLVRQLAREHEAAAVFVLCTCPLQVVKERLNRRTLNKEAISDGRTELLEAQAQDFDPVAAADQPLLELDTSREEEVAAAELLKFITRQLKGEGEPHATGRSSGPGETESQG
jgi:predicted kinase